MDGIHQPSPSTHNKMNSGVSRQKMPHERRKLQLIQGQWFGAYERSIVFKILGHGHDVCTSFNQKHG